MAATAQETLAIQGGTKIRTAAWPARALFGEEEKAAAVALFDKCIQTGSVIGYNGEEEDAYGKEFSAYLGGGFADGVNSGSSALYVALRALDLQPFTEVITPPITDPGGMMPVPLINCIPVAADVAPGSYNAGPDEIAARITPRTSAIVVAHISGHPADMPRIMELAAKHKLPVIEDCAQSHGATIGGRFVGTFGDVAAFSTMSGKHHATGPQGGVVFTKREDLYWSSRRASDRGKPFGLPAGSENAVASLNLNSNDLAAAIGRAQLKKLPGIVAARQKAADGIAEGCLRHLKAVQLNTGLPNTRSAYWFLLFRIDVSKLTVDKAKFVEALSAEGIPCGGGYFHAPSIAKWCRDRKVFGNSGYPWNSPLYKGDPNAIYDVPNARATDAMHFTVPIHERCDEQEVSDIVEALRKLERAFLR